MLSAGIVWEQEFSFLGNGLYPLFSEAH